MMENTKKILIVHIIVGLDAGGAELMLQRLVESQSHRTSCRHVVISLTSEGRVGPLLREQGIDVQTLGMKSIFDMPRILWRLRQNLRELRPDIIQTWMYHADFLGGVAARWAGIRNIVWGIRGTAIPQTGWSSTRIVVSLCAWGSHFLPRAIVCCAESARAAHAQLGYDQTKLMVIPNGYKLEDFNRTPALRQQARTAFHLKENALVIGVVGRFDPLKDYENFLRAAGLVAAKYKNNTHQKDKQIQFLMVGRGLNSGNKILAKWITENKIDGHCILAGEQHYVQLAYAAMDVFCLSSTKEGFPNVVCEAMAMEVPCVVTDAGDAALIVADSGARPPNHDRQNRE
jgi:glycosyltransferase involved in cell wall biosynthesis